MLKFSDIMCDDSRAREGASLCRKAIFIWAVREKGMFELLSSDLYPFSLNRYDI